MNVAHVQLATALATGGVSPHRIPELSEFFPPVPDAPSPKPDFASMARALMALAR